MQPRCVGTVTAHRRRANAATQAWPYRSDLDCVVEAPDGTFAAYVLCWYDEDNGVGEFEPVGTHPDYRRRGPVQQSVAMR